MSANINKDQYEVAEPEFQPNNSNLVFFNQEDNVGQLSEKEKKKLEQQKKREERILNFDYNNFTDKFWYKDGDEYKLTEQGNLFVNYFLNLRNLERFNKKSGNNLTQYKNRSLINSRYGPQQKKFDAKSIAFFADALLANKTLMDRFIQETDEAANDLYNNSPS